MFTNYYQQANLFTINENDYPIRGGCFSRDFVNRHSYLFGAENTMTKTMDEWYFKALDILLNENSPMDIANDKTNYERDLLNECEENGVKTNILRNNFTMKLYRSLNEYTLPLYNDDFRDRYSYLFDKVWNRIKNNDNKSELIRILNEQLVDGNAYCLRGKCMRLICVLCGFYDDMRMNISTNDQIINILILYKNKYRSQEISFNQLISRINLLLIEFGIVNKNEWLTPLNDVREEVIDDRLKSSVLKGIELYSNRSIGMNELKNYMSNQLNEIIEKNSLSNDEIKKLKWRLIKIYVKIVIPLLKNKITKHMPSIYETRDIMLMACVGLITYYSRQIYYKLE